jgi:hypothetical protein
MFKKIALLIAVVFSMLSIPAQAWRPDEITMLVIPREKIPLQIGQDISRRYPVLLVSYQMVHGDLKIHAWNGDNWVFVPVEDYTNGTFFTVPPKSAVIIENELFSAPDVLTPGSLWCGSASRLTSTDPRVMLHLLGLHFDFPFRHWNQLARRYGYAIEEINPTLKNVYWWHLQANVLMEKRAQRDFTVDVQNWQPLETIPAPVDEPVVMEEAVPETPAATDVDITVKAPETAPAVAPEPEPEPEPAPETPAAPSGDTPISEPVTNPEPAPVVEAAPDAPAVEPAVADSPAEEPAAATEPASDGLEEMPVTVDPFSAEEVPAAEIVVPAEPKKPWWKLF